MRRGNNGPKKGGLHDPVAQSIRAEQNRDAMPSPEEAKREHRNHLSEKGCHICGEDDPDKLTQEAPFHHRCKDLQGARPEPRVVCEEGHPSVRERKLEELQEKANTEGVPVVLYECNRYRTATEPNVEESPQGHPRRPDPRSRPEPRIKTYCGGSRCQSRIDEIIYPEEDQ